MTTEQLTFIKRRQHSKQRVEAWFEIFRILFPDKPLPPDPYTRPPESAAVSDFCTFLQDSLPRLLADKIRQGMHTNSWANIEQQEIEKNVAEVFEHLLREYEQRPSSISMDTREPGNFEATSSVIKLPGILPQFQFN
jgi:hypothetical protein